MSYGIILERRHLATGAMAGVTENIIVMRGTTEGSHGATSGTGYRQENH
mgnify:CR=1 FL=1